MEMETGAEFLIGAILYGLGFCIIAIILVVINNLLHKYWKPVKIWVPSYMADVQPPRFATDEEMNRIPPSMTETQPTRKD